MCVHSCFYLNVLYISVAYSFVNLTIKYETRRVAGTKGRNLIRLSSKATKKSKVKASRATQKVKRKAMISNRRSLNERKRPESGKGKDGKKKVAAQRGRGKASGRAILRAATLAEEKVARRNRRNKRPTRAMRNKGRAAARNSPGLKNNTPKSRMTAKRKGTQAKNGKQSTGRGTGRKNVLITVDLGASRGRGGKNRNTGGRVTTAKRPVSRTGVRRSTRQSGNRARMKAAAKRAQEQRITASRRRDERIANRRGVSSGRAGGHATPNRGKTKAFNGKKKLTNAEVRKKRGAQKRSRAKGKGKRSNSRRMVVG